MPTLCLYDLRNVDFRQSLIEREKKRKHTLKTDILDKKKKKCKNIKNKSVHFYFCFISLVFISKIKL